MSCEKERKWHMTLEKKEKFNWTSVVTYHKRQLASLNSGVTMSGEI